MFLHLSVILLTGGACVVAMGGHAWLFRGVCVVALGGGHVWLLWGGMCGCSGGRAWLLPGGTCVVAPGGVCMVAPGGHAWLLWGGHVWLLWGGRAWDTTRYRDMINERAVRILLECILVNVSSSCFSWFVFFRFEIF